MQLLVAVKRRGSRVKRRLARIRTNRYYGVKSKQRSEGRLLEGMGGREGGRQSRK